MASYDHKEIEPKWQAFWADNKTFRAERTEGKEKFYALDMFPYPSGAGLHVGHPLGYTATDIICRKRRHGGYNVLHPMGWDAFGLPAETYAIKTGTHPAITTRENIANFKRQIQALGFSYDWDREVDTTDPDYYRWTQWIFLKLYERGLAYESHMNVNWCPALGTVLANEEVIDGVSERGGHPVYRRPMRQWVLRITQYADRLLDDLNLLPEWPNKIKVMQENWIGRSEGIEIEYPVVGSDEMVRVYTKFPETNFGATFIVVAPEHEIVDKITTPEHKAAVEAYRQECSRKSDMERTQLAKDKTGVFTGSYVEHRLTQKKLPVYVADFVLAQYGTGMVVGVPAHDHRDFEFATKFNLPIERVVVGEDNDTGPVDTQEKVFEEGTIINSEFLDGLDSATAREKVKDYFEEKGWGKRKTTYRLRDWIFSRQRYWGEPIPVVHELDDALNLTGNHYAVDAADLPVTLPPMEDFNPEPSSDPFAEPVTPLDRAKDWVMVQGYLTEQNTFRAVTPECPAPAGKTVKTFKRETSTMPQWAGSSWYWLRFMDPQNANTFCDQETEKYWGPIDLYVGGAEHAVLHLLYARFWHKVLFDEGLVSTPEPFMKLVNQGMILGEDGQKMSKSVGNVINPDIILEEFGADTLRIYEMFMGPFDQVKLWSTSSVQGVRRFLERVWRNFEKPITDDAPDAELDTLLHQSIKKVGDDIEHFSFNTAVSQLMILTNVMTSRDALPRRALETFAVLISPFAPHIAEEFWEKLGHSGGVAYAPWPQYAPAKLVEATVTYAVQVNGKVRADFPFAKGATQDEVVAHAQADERVAKYLNEGSIVKTVFVPDKIVGFVVRSSD